MDGTEQREIRLDFKLELKDIHKFYFCYNIPVMKHIYERKVIAGVIHYLSLFFAILAYLQMKDGKEISILEKPSLLIPITIIILIVFSLICNIFYDGVKRTVSDKTIFKEQHYLIKDSGIEVNTEYLDAKVKWEEIFKVKESKERFLIFTGTKKALVIPKRILSDERQISVLKEIFKTNLPDNKLKLL